MQPPESKPRITRDRYSAVLFDLDGVITNTANLHAACWKQMFDEFLEKHATQGDEPFRPFDLDADYRLYVDGKTRSDGVRDFLSSRGIQVPEGSPADPQNAETVCGLGNRKNDLVNKIIEEKGVEPYEGSVELIRQLRGPWIQVGFQRKLRNAAHGDARFPLHPIIHEKQIMTALARNRKQRRAKLDTWRLPA